MPMSQRQRHPFKAKAGCCLLPTESIIAWDVQNDSLATLLARMESILGPLPRWMLRKGRYSHRFYTRAGVLYEQARDTVLASSLTLTAYGCSMLQH